MYKVISVDKSIEVGPKIIDDGKYLCFVSRIKVMELNSKKVIAIEYFLLKHALWYRKIFIFEYTEKNRSILKNTLQLTISENTVKKYEPYEITFSGELINGSLKSIKKVG